MSQGTTTVEQRVAARLEETQYRQVVCLGEDAGSRLDRRDRSLTDVLAEQTGRSTVVVDGRTSARSRGVLYRAVCRWVEDHRNRRDDPEAIRLFDKLTMAMDIGSPADEPEDRAVQFVDTFVRLVERLAETEPVVIVVGAPEELAEVERRALRSVMRQMAASPLAQVDTDGAGVAPVGFVWCGRAENWDRIECESIDSSEAPTTAVREYLTDDRVVERIAETTDGDPRRLDALVGALPESVSQLWIRRIRELGPAERRVVEYLAVADAPLEVGFVDRLVDVSAVSVIQQLEDDGIVDRRMREGAIEVEVASPEIRNGIEQSLDDETRCQLHRVLARTAIEAGSEADAFVARHALEGGDRRLGLRHGVGAARQLLRRGQWDRAGRLLEMLEAIEELEETRRREILELRLRLAEGRGDWNRALKAARRLVELADEAEQRGGYHRRIATCLVETGRPDDARDHFRSALDELGDDRGLERVRVMVGWAELAYRAGDYEAARDRVVGATELLAADEDYDEALAGRLRLECGNILGKVALYRGELDEARRHFERNGARARQLGRQGEEVRAEVNLGVVAVQQRRFDEAERRLNRGLEDQHRLTENRVRVNCWLNLGVVYQRRGEFDRALDFYRRSVREAVRRCDDVATEIATHNLATTYQDIGAYREARRLIEREADPTADAEDGSFAGSWRPMVEAQILLERQEPGRALEVLERAEESLTGARRLYGTEMRLRRARAHLMLDQLEAASELLDSVDVDEANNPQLEPLHDYYRAAVRRREGESVDETRWRSIIEQLEGLGLFQAAVAARVELAGLLLECGESDSESPEVVLERGVEQLRRRADSVPDRFRSRYFEIPAHRQLLEMFEELRGGDLDEQLSGYRADGAPEHGQDGTRSQSSGTTVDRDDPAYRKWRSRFADMIGEDESMLRVFEFIDRVAPGDTTVLLSGESGTGKELVAEAIHRESRRSDQPFVKVNCAAFVEELLLSELFGHEKGAFTGAVDDRVGHFERADGGTIFLDEIGDISPKTQVSLLRVLQEGAFEAVGGTETRQVDVRVVAATNRNLEQMVREGDFRLDLYYRLKGFVIDVPPLRERRQDIPRLLRYFARLFSPDESAPQFSEEVVQFLANYRWPGNVRELENFVRSVLLFARGDRIGMEHIQQFSEFFSEEAIDETLPAVDADVQLGPVSGETAVVEAGETEEALVEQTVANERSLSKLKDRLEHKCIERALRQTGGNISQAARILQMKRPRLSQIVNGDDELLALKEELVG